MNELVLIVIEMKKMSRKIDRILFHIPRCKNQKDKTKLILMAVSYTLYYSSLILAYKKIVSNINISNQINL